MLLMLSPPSDLLAVPEWRAAVKKELGAVDVVGIERQRIRGRNKLFQKFAQHFCQLATESSQKQKQNRNRFKACQVNKINLHLRLYEWIRFSSVILFSQFGIRQIKKKKIALPILCFTIAVYFENGMKSLHFFFFSLSPPI